MKKNIAGVVLIAMMTASFAFADTDWIEDFKKVYSEKGVDGAVEITLAKGVSPEDILKYWLEMTEINPAGQEFTPDIIIRALLCAGINGEEITKIAEFLKVPEEDVVIGYKNSVSRCGDGLVDSQTYSQTFNPMGNSGSMVAGGTPYSDVNEEQPGDNVGGGNPGDNVGGGNLASNDQFQ